MPFLSSPTVTSVDADSAVPNVEFYTTIQDYIFSGGAQGFWYDTDLIFTDTAGTTAATTAGDLIAHAEDQSGNDHDATQSTTADRPQYQTSPERMVFDKVADSLEVTIPTGGWTGTMVLATDDGTASYGVDLPAGTYDVGGRYMPGGAIIGVAVHNGALSEADSDAIEDYFVSKGATASYSSITSFNNFWRSWDEITSFPLIDTSSGTDFSRAWRECSSLTSFPLIDTSSGTSFLAAWALCTSLTTIPAGLFDAIAGGNFNSAFTMTNLTQTSIDNILASLVTSGVNSGIRAFNQTGGSAPSSAGETDIDTLRSRGWTVTVTGGY